MLRKRGLTLIEVLVVAGLLGLVMTFVGPVLAPAGRVMQRVDVDTRAQQTAVVALEKLFQEIGYSDPRGVTLGAQAHRVDLAYPSSQPVGWNSLAPLLATDLNTLNLFTAPIVWQKFSIISYDDTSHNLVRKDFPYAGASQLAQILPSRLVALATGARPSAIIASDVKSFTLDQPTSAVLHVDITVSQKWDQERITHLQTDICLRN